MDTEPSDAVTSPVMVRATVDFPAPFDPINATTPPARISNDTSNSARYGPYEAETCLTSSTEPLEARSPGAPGLAPAVAATPWLVMPTARDRRGALRGCPSPRRRSLRRSWRPRP